MEPLYASQRRCARINGYGNSSFNRFKMFTASSGLSIPACTRSRAQFSWRSLHSAPAWKPSYFPSSCKVSPLRVNSQYFHAASSRPSVWLFGFSELPSRVSIKERRSSRTVVGWQSMLLLTMSSFIRSISARICERILRGLLNDGNRNIFNPSAKESTVDGSFKACQFGVVHINCFKKGVFSTRYRTTAKAIRYRHALWF